MTINLFDAMGNSSDRVRIAIDGGATYTLDRGDCEEYDPHGPEPARRRSSALLHVLIPWEVVTLGKESSGARGRAPLAAAAR